MTNESIKIHSESGGTHPQWVDADNQELTICPFTKEERAAEEIKEINAQLQQVLEDAPSDAGAELSVEQTDEGYSGVLSISSAAGHFVSEVSSGESRRIRFRDLVDRLISDVRTQIEDWKSTRALNN